MAKQKNKPTKRGAPSKYTDELFDQICETIATTERGVHSICKELKINPSTFYDWIKKSDDLSNKYTRAKEIQMDLMAEKILEISDDSSQDEMMIEGKNGKLIAVENREFVNRSRLRTDTRKWLMSKLNPKKYGDRIEVEQTTQFEQPLFPEAKKDANKP